MHDTLSADQVLALAPDAAAAKAGRLLAAPRSWESLGSDGRAVWGECRGSAKDPYRTQVDLAGPAYRCSCPSRKLPCKHTLGLLLLLAAEPKAFGSAPPPGWVAEWLESRARAAAKSTARPPEPGTPEDAGATRRRAASQARTAASREAKVGAGMEELGRWLRDQVREGLALAPSRPATHWGALAARMVDAQAPGAARMVRELSGIAASGDGWQPRMLERLGRLHMLAEAYRRIETLPPETQADVRAALGFTVSQEELLAQPGLLDEWQVLGMRVEEEEQLRVQRTWLLGRTTGRPALLLAFAAPGQPLERSLAPGTALDAELVFYPGAAPLRALLRQQVSAPRPPASLLAFSAGEATAAYAAALARNPWLDRYPACVGPATLARSGERWLLRDEAGDCLPIRGAFESAWRLLAATGGASVVLAGEWDGETLAALGAWFAGHYLPLEGRAS